MNDTRRVGLLKVTLLTSVSSWPRHPEGLVQYPAAEVHVVTNSLNVGLFTGLSPPVDLALYMSVSRVNLCDYCVCVLRGRVTCTLVVFRLLKLTEQGGLIDITTNSFIALDLALQSNQDLRHYRMISPQPKSIPSEGNMLL